MITLHPRAPCRSCILLYPSPVPPGCFWLVVVRISIIWRPFQAASNFFLLLIVDQFDGPNDTWRHPTRSSQVGSLLHRPPLTPAFFLLLRCSAKWRPPRPMPRLSLSLFWFDQFSDPNNGITSSPHVPTQRRLFFDVSPNVGTNYWLIVVFLKRTAAIKVEAPPTSLIFDGCHSGAPNKGTGAGKCKTDGSQPAHTHKGTTARWFGGKSPQPMETEGQSRQRVGGGR